MRANLNRVPKSDLILAAELLAGMVPDPRAAVEAMDRATAETLADPDWQPGGMMHGVRPVSDIAAALVRRANPGAFAAESEGA